MAEQKLRNVDPKKAEAVERLFPRDDRYVHSHGTRGHGADHVLPAFVSPSLSVPVESGQPLLVTVSVDSRDDGEAPRLTAQGLAPLDQAAVEASIAATSTTDALRRTCGAVIAR